MMTAFLILDLRMRIDTDTLPLALKAVWDAAVSAARTRGPRGAYWDRSGPFKILEAMYLHDDFAAMRGRDAGEEERFLCVMKRFLSGMCAGDEGDRNSVDVEFFRRFLFGNEELQPSWYGAQTPVAPLEYGVTQEGRQRIIL